ncbi:MAG: serine/threonine protein kinase [Planctomycetes bacterium]|nr:serine/threonine protein kinase [Planctomycetota bacterium]
MTSETPEDSIETRKVGPAPGPGFRIGGCVLEKRIGEGGMGTVWEARQLSLDRVVAVKLLASGLSSDKAYIERFKREAKAAGRINHRNIVAIHDAGTEAGLGYIVMERLQGWSLQDRLDKQGAFAEAEALDLLAQTARGLDAAHRSGLVHRDIKPGNIFLCGDGTAKILDFGLARDCSSSITQPGERLGTPHYMSPEACDGKPVDERSDLYSLGATMYAALAGTPPFRADTPVALLRKHVDEPPKPLEKVRGATNDLVLAMLAKAPPQRPANASEIARAAEAILGGKPVPRLRPPVNLKPVAYVSLAVVILLFGAVSAKILLSKSGLTVVPVERERAQRFAAFKVAAQPDTPGRGILVVTLSPKSGMALCGSLGELHGHKHRRGEFGIDLSSDPGIALEKNEILHEDLRKPTPFRVAFLARSPGTHTIYVAIRYQALDPESERADSFETQTIEIPLPVVVE